MTARQHSYRSGLATTVYMTGQRTRVCDNCGCTEHAIAAFGWRCEPVRPARQNPRRVTNPCANVGTQATPLRQENTVTTPELLPYQVRADRFPECCNAVIFHRLPGAHGRIDVPVQSFKAGLERASKDYTHKYMQFLIANLHQEKTYGTAIRELGFVCVHGFEQIGRGASNPHHGMYVYVKTKTYNSTYFGVGVVPEQLPVME